MLDKARLTEEMECAADPLFGEPIAADGQEAKARCADNGADGEGE